MEVRAFFLFSILQEDTGNIASTDTWMCIRYVIQGYGCGRSRFTLAGSLLLQTCPLIRIHDTHADEHDLTPTDDGSLCLHAGISISPSSPPPAPSSAPWPSPRSRRRPDAGFGTGFGTSVTWGGLVEVHGGNGVHSKLRFGVGKIRAAGLGIYPFL
jgi:hypothetical protein